MNGLPPTWTRVPLRQLGRWVGGGTPSKRVPSFWSGEIPWVSPKDMKVPRIQDTQDHITPRAVEESAATLVPAGSVLVVTRSGILRHSLPVAVAGRQVALNQDLKALTVAEGFDADYVAWALRSFADQILHTCAKSGTTVNNLDTANLLAFEIPLAPSNEQRRIVAAIEEHFSRVDAASTSLADAARRLNLLRCAAIDGMLDGAWKRAPLSEIATVITKGTTPTSIGHKFTVDGILFVKAESLASGFVDHDRCARISSEADEALRRSRLAEGDVLVTIAGTLGRVGVVRDMDLPANTNQAVSIIRLRDPSTMPWVAAWLRGSIAQRELMAGGRGVGLQNLNLKQVGAVSVPLPPPHEQRRIVALVEKQLSTIDALRAATARTQRMSQSLRRAVLERAFQGKLLPQDPSDEPAAALLERIGAERDAVPATPSRRRRATA